MGTKLQSKQDEIHQIGEYLQKQGIEKITLIVASSIGADLGLTFLSQMKIPIEHTFLMEVNLHRFQDRQGRLWFHFCIWRLRAFIGVKERL